MMPRREPDTESSLPRRALSTGLLLLTALMLAAWALSGQFAEVSMAALRTAWQGQTAGPIATSLALTALSFACLGLYDRAAARVVAPQISGAWAWQVGMVANAVSNTLGFHAVTGTLLRLRLYGRCGLSPGDVARIVSLSWLALGLGFITMVALAELLRGLTAPQAGTALAVGLALGCSLAGFVAWLARAPRELSLWRWRQPLPPARMALQQLVIGAVESSAALGALYVLLPVDLAPPFSLFAVGCIAAMALGVVAHVPGGVGVFEASITALLSGAGRADLLAALLLYRAIYNLLPFLISLISLLSLARLRPQFDRG